MTVFAWYMKRQWLDREPGIDAVYIHYTWTPLDIQPDWGQHRETRLMEQHAMIKEGMGGTTVADDQIINTEVQERPANAPEHARVKILKLPTRIRDPRLDDWTEHYLFHHFFEVHQHGRVWTSELFSEEIVCQDIEYIDYVGNISGVCAHWSVFDFDAQQYVPSETQEFIERFGEENEFRAFKLYRYPDRDRFVREKMRLLRQLPLPHRWRSKVWGPRGAEVMQGWHVGLVDEIPPPGQPLHVREEWTGYRTFILGKKPRPAEQQPAAALQPPLSEIVLAQASVEEHVGEIYVILASRFADNPELHAMWRTMALEEGGHAALLRAISKGLVAGVLQARAVALPLASLEALITQAATSRRQVEEGVRLEQALRLTWEIETSEFDFMRDLLVASSNLTALGFPMTSEEHDAHTGRLRQLLQKYTTDTTWRREARFLTVETTQTTSAVVEPGPLGQSPER